MQVVGFSHSCLVIYWMSDGEFAIVSWIARSGLYFSKIFEGGFYIETKFAPRFQSFRLWPSLTLKF